MPPDSHVNVAHHMEDTETSARMHSHFFARIQCLKIQCWLPKQSLLLMCCLPSVLWGFMFLRPSCELGLEEYP